MTPARVRTLCASTALMLVLVSCWRITATYDEFWQTWDEPFHLAAGLEWWSQGDYSYERFHPPLARVAIAFLPWMAGLKSDPTAVNHWAEGNEISCMPAATTRAICVSPASGSSVFHLGLRCRVSLGDALRR